MQFSDLALSRRLERAEGHACAQFADARRRLFPDSGSEWMQFSGAYAVFDGIGSPVTQTFGLGIFEDLTAASLDVIERFFLDRGAQVDHEVSPHAGVAALSLLCSRRYQPIEISNVMYRPIEKPADEDHANIRVRVTDPEEAQLYSRASLRGHHMMQECLQTGHPDGVWRPFNYARMYMDRHKRKGLDTRTSGTSRLLSAKRRHFLSARAESVLPRRVRWPTRSRGLALYS